MLAAGANLTATVSFTPPSAAPAIGTLGFTSDGGAATLALSGTGIAATPATLGHDQIGAQLDWGSVNHMNGSRVTTVSGRAITSISVYMRNVQAAPSNRYQLAIYTDVDGKPGSLVAATTIGTLTAHSWNTLPMSASLTAGSYWLMFNTDGDNNMSYDAGTAGGGAYGVTGATFGSWPAAFGDAVTHNGRYSIYVG